MQWTGPLTRRQRHKQSAFAKQPATADMQLPWAPASPPRDEVNAKPNGTPASLARGARQKTSRPVTLPCPLGADRYAHFCKVLSF